MVDDEKMKHDSNSPAPRKVARMTSLTVDVEAEDGGSWEKIPDMEGAELRVRSLEYPPYRLAEAAHNRAHSRKYRNEQTAESVEEDYRKRGELLARYILLGWRGFDEEYDADVARARLAAREWRPLREWVYVCAMRVGQRAVEFVETTEKN